MAELGSTTITGTLNVTGKVIADNVGENQVDLSGLTATVAELNYCDGVTSNIQTQLNNKAASSHTHNYAASSHGNHVPTTQTASNKVFLRNDNTWATVTPANIGAAASSHGNHVPATQTASNKVFLRNDNTWQTITPANIGAAASSHTHNYAASGHTHTLSALGAKFTQIVANGSAATSATWTSGAYDFLIGTIRPYSSNTPACFSCTVHANIIQITDEVQCTKMAVTTTGISRSSGSGTIYCLYGVNVV